MDIELTSEQESRIDARRAASAHRGSKLMAEGFREMRREWQDDGRARAKRGDPLHEAGCLLYWAEGTKSRNTVSLTNSDIHLMRFFLRFLRSCFGIDDSELAFHLTLYTGNGLTVQQIEAHWLKMLLLPRTCLRKHVVDNRTPTTTGTKIGKLPYGTATLRVLRSTQLVQHIYGAIQEYGEFEEPRWLDL